VGSAQLPGGWLVSLYDDCITSKIDALSGLRESQQVLALAAEEMRRVSEYHLSAHLLDIYQVRAGSMSGWVNGTGRFRTTWSRSDMRGNFPIDAS
jgi:hypothetical protein